MFTDEADVELDVLRGGLELDVTVEKRAGESLGVEIQSAVFDRVRTCDNHCEFCFIYQLPKGMRRSLYLKDDDYRLRSCTGTSPRSPGSPRPISSGSSPSACRRCTCRSTPPTTTCATGCSRTRGAA